MQEFSVEYFQSADGSYPAEAFILSQEVKMRAKLLRLLDLLEQEGNNLREPNSKPLGSGIYEIRAQQGNNIARVLYFFVVGRKIILTNGFVKKTQKTPQSEINTATKYRAEYYRREGISNGKELS